MKKAPSTRLGWHHYYAARWSRTNAFDALHLAIWYLVLHLEYDDPEFMT